MASFVLLRTKTRRQAKLGKTKIKKTSTHKSSSKANFWTIGDSIMEFNKRNKQSAYKKSNSSNRTPYESPDNYVMNNATKELIDEKNSNNITKYDVQQKVNEIIDSSEFNFSPDEKRDIINNVYEFIKQ